MHPEVRSDKPGKCPKCGMNLVPTKRQVGETKVARLRIVKLGETDGQRTLVLSGLKIGDEVIVRSWQSIVREDALCAILLPTVVAPLRAKR
jgi:multidrug efflux pump subunit AcrA (membrane-fusion protein)